MLKIDFYEISKEKEPELTYVVICTVFRGEWIFVRHMNRETWEIPGGHIEPGENPDEAAERELREETGASGYELIPVCDYSVENFNSTGYGRLYLATIHELKGLLEHEISEIRTGKELPDDLTYGDIQPYLLEEVKQRCKNKIHLPG